MKALSGTEAPLALATAVGLGEPALGNFDDEAEGLGDELAVPPVDEEAVTTLAFEDEPVVVAEGAMADRT